MFAGGDSNLYGYVSQNPINGIDPPGLSDIKLFPPGSLLHDYDKNIVNFNPDSKVFSIGGHGNSFRLDRYNAYELAMLIRSDIRYLEGMPVQLNACNVGNGPNSLAQELSNVLNVEVTAPTDFIEIFANGDIQVLHGGVFQTFVPGN